MPERKLPTRPEYSKDRALGAQIDASFNNFHEQILNHVKPSAKGTEKDMQAHETLEDAKDLITRNNIFADRIYGPEFAREIRNPEQELAGNVCIGIVHCPDGRMPRYPFSYILNTSEYLGGVIPTRKRTSDELLIPKSASFGESLRSPKVVSRGLVQINLSHTACAANEATLKDMKTNPANHSDHFKPEEIRELLTLRPDVANRRIIKRITSRAITNFMNASRSIAGEDPLPQVCIEGNYDISSMGIEFRNGNDELSTTDLVQRYKTKIQDLGIVDFGHFQDTFTRDETYFDLLKTKTAISKAILKEHTEIFSPLLQEIDNYFSRNFSDLNQDQKSGLRFVVVDRVAFQYEKGLNPEHPYTEHDEKFIVLSDRGVLLGKYLPDQHFGTSVSDPKDGAHQLITETKVLDDKNLLMDKPRTVFLCGSVSDYEVKNDTKGVKDAKQDIVDMLTGLIANPTIRKQMKNGRLIPIPALMDEKTRRVLSIPDFSPYL